MENQKKYVFTDETIKVGGAILHRIKAAKSFSNPSIEVSEGQLEGFIENEQNLSHLDTCWVSEQAKVFGEAQVRRNALVKGQAKVFGKAQVSGMSEIEGQAKIFDKAQIYGEATLNGNLCIFGETRVCGHASVFGDSHIYGKSKICGDALLDGAKVESTYIENARIVLPAYINFCHIVSDKDFMAFNAWWCYNELLFYTFKENRWNFYRDSFTSLNLCKYFEYRYGKSVKKEFERMVEYVEVIKADRKRQTD